jgi:hypothetical protein
MAHDSSSSSAPNAASINLTIPVTAEVGDLAVIGVATSTSFSQTLPSGWDVRVAADSGNLRCSVITRVLQAGDIGDVINIPFGASQKGFGFITILTGAADSPTVPTPIADNTENATRTGITTTLPATRQVLTGVFGRGNSSPTNWTPPAGTTRTTQAFGSGTGACDGAVAYVEAGAGSLAAGTWVSDIADLRSLVWMLVFTPASTPLGTPVVSVTVQNPSTPGASDGEIDVTWASIPFADHYQVEHAPGLDASTGFTVDNASVTGTAYTIIGLPSGSYTVGVTALPAS